MFGTWSELTLPPVSVAQVSIAVDFSFAVVASACICPRSPIRCSTWPSPSTAASRAVMNGSLPPSAIVAAWLSSVSCLAMWSAAAPIIMSPTV